MPSFLPRPALEASLVRELRNHSPLLVLGARGSGKTTLLGNLREGWDGPGPASFVRLEPIACAPEVLEHELLELASDVIRPTGWPSSAAPLARLFASLARRAPGSLLLLDDLDALRALSAYPGVTKPLERFVDSLQDSGATVMTSRFGYWFRRELPSLKTFEIPPVGADELETMGVPHAGDIVRLTGGLMLHTARLAQVLDSGKSLEDALVSELLSGGGMEIECRATLADLLHRARGYGACKAVLRVLADEEGLRLSDVALRLGRTAGASRDYLRWLEEVDLIRVREKRFFFVDPVLRLWHRIYGRGAPAHIEDVREEVLRHLGSVVPASAARPTDAFTLPPPPSEDLVEID